MKCSVCGAASSVLDTRAQENSTIMRRRQCTNCGEIFKTYEVHETGVHNGTVKRVHKTLMDRQAILFRNVEFAKNMHKWKDLAEKYNVVRASVYAGSLLGRNFLDKVKAYGNKK